MHFGEFYKFNSPLWSERFSTVKLDIRRNTAYKL